MFAKPSQSISALSDLVLPNLSRVIAIDSQSNESSQSIPSSEGQRLLSLELSSYFQRLGYAVEQDAFANLLVNIPSNLPAGRTCPKIALMAHLDTSEGTHAVPQLNQIKSWDGSRIPYPDNAFLNVSVANYPNLKDFVGQDVLFGPGKFPIGLDNKVGMTEIMTLAEVLSHNPHIEHGDLVLVFRPDEEIGRMAAVQGLVDVFVQRGVSHGYTIDGIHPFEINIENFNASRARLHITPQKLLQKAYNAEKLLELALTGVTTHGALAKAEGHLNSIVIMVNTLEALGSAAGVQVIDFQSEAANEANAKAKIILQADSPDELAALEQKLEQALHRVVNPHAWKGARVEVTSAEIVTTKGLDFDDGASQALRYVGEFLKSNQISPLLPEESDNFQGYSNPYAITREGDKVLVDHRLRDFDPISLKRREEHVAAIAQRVPGSRVEVTQQYINMGPELKKFPEVVRWATQALEIVGKPADERPIRGGTGVDPFLEKGIPLANLGTGYFAAESEKELTSRQMIAEHVLWLVGLVQVVAQGNP